MALGEIFLPREANSGVGLNHFSQLGKGTQRTGESAGYGGLPL